MSFIELTLTDVAGKTVKLRHYDDEVVEMRAIEEGARFVLANGEHRGLVKAGRAIFRQGVTKKVEMEYELE